MKKILAVLISSFFVVGAFAASHVGAPMAGASDAKPTMAEKAEAKSDMMEQKTHKKAHKMRHKMAHKKAKMKAAMADEKAEMKEAAKK
jgi:hypothetical protein